MARVFSQLTSPLSPTSSPSRTPHWGVYTTLESAVRKTITAALMGSLFALAACSNPSDASDSGSGSDSGGDIVIGLAGDFSGDYAFYDASLRDGAQFAVDQLNAAGGIDGRKLELIAKDTQGDQTEGVRATQELIDAGASYLIGTTAPAFNAQAAVACEAGVPVSTGDITAPTVVAQAGDCAYQVIMGDNVQAAVAAEEAVKKGFRTAFVLESGDHPYTEGLPKYFTDAFEHDGGQVVGTESYKIGAGDFSVQATKIAALDPQPDIVFTPMFGADLTTFIKQLRSAGVTSQYMSGDALADPSVLKAGDSIQGAIGTAHAWPAKGNDVQGFFDDYKAANGKEPSSVIVALGFDEINLIAQIIKDNGGDSSPSAIADGLQNATFTGVTGHLTMNPETRLATKDVAIIEIKDGKIVNIGTATPDYVPAPLS
jgi:branched-chain amino acid transport system substrate-binding protein